MQIRRKQGNMWFTLVPLQVSSLNEEKRKKDREGEREGGKKEERKKRGKMSDRGKSLGVFNSKYFVLR